MSDSIRDQLLATVVDPIFAALPPFDGLNLPPKVREARLRRAREGLAGALALRDTHDVPDGLRNRISDLARKGLDLGFDASFQAHLDKLELDLAPDNLDELARHRQWLREKYGHVELRGLQTVERVFQDLEKVFVPLRVEGPGTIRLKIGDGEFETPMVSDVSELVGKPRRLLILGGPGSGKSTLLQWLATRSEEPRPVLVVPIRSLDGPPTVKSVAALNELDPKTTNAMLRGGALVLLDGLDEGVALGSRLRRSINHLANQFQASTFVVTSRPAGVERVTQLPEFEVVRLQPLTREEVDRFVERWFLAAELSVASERSGVSARSRAEKAADDLKRRLRASPAVGDVARTPLVASVVCVVHRFLGHKLPERVAALYEACTNVLLYEWDRAKFSSDSLVGRLDAPQKRLILADLALKMHEAKQMEWPVDEVAAVFASRLPEVGMSALDAGGILGEVRDRSGLLVERRPGWFGFSHLSFQEYLAAIEIVRTERVPTLVERAESPWWQEVAIMAAGLPNCPTEVLIGGLLRREGTTMEVLSARALEAAIAAPTRIRAEVSRRIENLVPPYSSDQAYRLRTVGSAVGPLLVRHLRDADPDARSWSAGTLIGVGYRQAWRDVVPLLTDMEFCRRPTTSNLTVSEMVAIQIFFDADGFEYFKNFNELRDASVRIAWYWKELDGPSMSTAADEYLLAIRDQLPSEPATPHGWTG